VIPGPAASLIVVIGVLLLMVVELQLSFFNERALRARGAVEPEDDPYRLMRLAYPGAFIAMGIEGATHLTLNRDLVLAGLVLLGCAKALKFWVMTTLRERWTFKVLVPKDASLVTGGPYRFVNHPNYVAVILELVAVAIVLSAPVAGLGSVLLFVWILRRRIAVEDRALGRH
jgi:methyltransferase